MLTGAIAAPTYAAIVFTSGWGEGPGKVPGWWIALHSADPHRMAIERDPKSPRGGNVLRVEVRSGDKVNNWSGERCEVMGMVNPKGQALPVTSASGHEFYGLSVKLDPKWRSPTKNEGGFRWGTFFQLHGPDDLHGSPSVALMVDETFHLDLCVGDLFDGGKRERARGAAPQAFSDGSLNAGHWNEFLLDVVWAADEKGSITVYRRDDGKKSEWVKVFDKQATPTLQFKTGEKVRDHYWKAGLYRSESPHTNTLWLGPIVRGDKRDEVAKAAFGRP